jgi:replicative DNA helicase
MATTIPLAAGRVPPHDLDAEMSVLGSILLDPLSVAKVLQFLHPEDFYRENNGQIYRAALDLFAAGEPIDNVTMAAQLQTMGMLDRIGGRTQLATMQSAVPTAANIEYYSRIVKEKAYKRRLISAGGNIAGYGYDDSIEAEDAINQAQSLVFGVADDRDQRDLAKLYDLLGPAMERISLQMESGHGIVGIPSGFHDLDRMTGGFKDSDLIIVAGRPAMGKTSWILNVALHAALEAKKSVAIFSLEMSKEQLTERLLTEQAQIDAQRMHRGLLTELEFDRVSNALGPLGEADLFIDDTPVMDELTLQLKARQAKMRHDVDMILVDYLQLMHGRKGGDDNRVQEVSAISRALKGLARELRIPVIAISQLSRAPEQRPDKRPILSDLRESGCLAGDTPIYLPDTGQYVPIRDLVGRSGFRVLALDHGWWRMDAKNVTRVFATGTKPVFKLSTQLGRSVRATGNHKFLTIEGWRRLDEFKAGDRIALPRALQGLHALPAMQAAGISTRAMQAGLGSKYSGSGIYEQNQGRERAKRLAEVVRSDDLELLATSDVYWDPVTAIEPDGIDDVFDLTVEDLHNFVAGNVIAHNSIEQDSDLVMFLFRPEYYKSEERPGIAEVIVAKHRNGPTGTIELKFRRDHTRFYNLETRRPEPGTE